MKNFLLLSLLFMTFPSFGQNESIQWFTNMEEAKAYSTENETNILMVFSGSDWCKPCIKLRKDVLESAVFQEWAKERMVVLYLDFPARRKNKLSKETTKHNEALAERFNKSGVFPNVFVLNSKEDVLINPNKNLQNLDLFIADLEGSLTKKD